MMACMSKGASSSGYSISGGVPIDSLRLVESSWHRRIRLAGHLRGLPVEAEAARAEGDDVKEPAGHHQVLVEVDHVALIPGRQMQCRGRQGQAEQQPIGC